jgi:arylformamidase
MDRRTVESEYQPSFRVASMSDVIDGYRRRGEDARASLPHRRIAYGDHPDEWSWYVPGPAPGAPLFVFVHGGYWRRLSADDGCLLAPAAHTLGYAFASVNYTLCPAAPLATLVDQTQRALTALVADDAREGHDTTRVHVAGHSAGAHLAATAALAGVPVAGLVLVSGVFDITPIVHTTINDDVRLDEAEARRLSPLFAIASPVPVDQVVTWSTGDTDEFARQARDWAARWAAVPGNRQPVVVEVAGRHHFDVIDDLLDPATELGRAVIDQIGAPTRP